MLALPSVFVSRSYKYGWTPSSSFPSLSLLEILLLSEAFVPPDSVFRHLSNNSIFSFGHVFYALLLAFCRVILSCFWLKMRLCVHDNANPIQSTFVKRHQSSCLFRGASQKHRGKPLLLTISVLGSFTCITQHTGPTALRPIRRTKQLWLSVLLKDTSAATGNRTHILFFSDNTRT